MGLTTDGHIAERTTRSRLISSLVWIIHTAVTWYWKVRPQRWRAACVDWKQTGGECWLEVVMWALASRWPWGSYTQTRRWQNKLQKVGLERTHNNSAWPVFVSVHSNWPCLITATTFQFIPSRAKDGNEFLSDSRTSGLFFFKPLVHHIGPVFASILEIERNSNAVRRFIKPACAASDTGPLSVNREHISGAPTHSTGGIMQPTPGRHFGSGASHLRNIACSDELVRKP